MTDACRQFFRLPALLLAVSALLAVPLAGAAQETEAAAADTEAAGSGEPAPEPLQRPLRAPAPSDLRALPGTPPTGLVPDRVPIGSGAAATMGLFATAAAETGDVFVLLEPEPGRGHDALTRTLLAELPDAGWHVLVLAIPDITTLDVPVRSRPAAGTANATPGEPDAADSPGESAENPEVAGDTGSAPVDGDPPATVEREAAEPGAETARAEPYVIRETSPESRPSAAEVAAARFQGLRGWLQQRATGRVVIGIRGGARHAFETEVGDFGPTGLVWIDIAGVPREPEVPVLLDIHSTRDAYARVRERQWTGVERYVYAGQLERNSAATVRKIRGRLRRLPVSFVLGRR